MFIGTARHGLVVRNKMLKRCAIITATVLRVVTSHISSTTTVVVIMIQLSLLMMMMTCGRMQTPCHVRSLDPSSTARAHMWGQGGGVCGSGNVPSSKDC